MFARQLTNLGGISDFTKLDANSWLFWVLGSTEIGGEVIPLFHTTETHNWGSSTSSFRVLCHQVVSSRWNIHNEWVLGASGAMRLMCFSCSTETNLHTSRCKFWKITDGMSAHALWTQLEPYHNLNRTPGLDLVSTCQQCCSSIHSGDVAWIWDHLRIRDELQNYFWKQDPTKENIRKSYPFHHVSIISAWWISRACPIDTRFTAYLGGAAQLIPSLENWTCCSYFCWCKLGRPTTGPFQGPP